jgi:hypothetical protein
MFSCAGPGSDSSDNGNPTEDNGSDGTEENTDLSFVGHWDIQEDLTGCGETGTKNYHVEIIQNNNDNRDTYTLMQIDDEFIFDCGMIGDKLSCNGEIHYENGDIHYYHGYYLWFINSSELVGEASWGFNPHNGSYCSGGYSVLKKATRVNHTENSGN